MKRQSKKLALSITTVILVFVIGSTVGLNRIIYQNVVQQCGERGLSIVRSMAELIDVELLLDVVDKQDKNNSDYLNMVELFTRVCHENDVLYLYTIHYDEEGVVRYGVVADGLDDTLGLIVAEDDLSPELQSSLDKGAQIYEQPYMTEQWGILMTSSTPIRDKAGNIVGALGVDFSQEDLINRTTKQLKQTTVAITVFGILISCLACIFCNRVVEGLEKHADEIASR